MELSSGQSKALSLIGVRVSTEAQEWVTAEDIDPRPLRKLEELDLIEWHVNDADRRVARLRPKGYRELNLVAPAAETKSVTPPPSPLPASGEGEQPSDYGAHPCVVPGCREPRMVSISGKPLSMCQHHQREYWRNQKQGVSNGDPHPVREKPFANVMKPNGEPKAEKPHPWSYEAAHGKEPRPPRKPHPVNGEGEQEINLERMTHLQTLGAIMIEALMPVDGVDDASIRLERIYDLANAEWKEIVQVVNTDLRKVGG